MGIENLDALLSDSSTENEGGSEPSQEGDNTPDETSEESDEKKPLHKEKRFQEVYGRMRGLEREVQALRERALSNEPKEVSTQPSNPPNWFTDAFGDNPRLFQDFQTYSKAEREAVKREIYEEMQRKSSAETEADVAAEKFISNELQDMENEGLEFDHNELMKFAIDNPIVGSENNIDLRRILNLMNMVKGSSPSAKTVVREERKKLSATGQTPGSEPKPKDFFTDKDFENRGWGGLR